VPTIAADILIGLTRSLFESANIPPGEAEIVARSLVEANLRGHDSHGVLRIPQYLDFVRDGKAIPGAPLTILDESPALLAADAGWGLGQVQAHRLIDLLIPKARAVGIAAGTLRRCGHTGRLGEYAERAAQERLALICAVNSHGAGHRVAPPGGSAGRLSTNPLCIGVPTETDSIILDMATCVGAEGKVRDAYQNGKSLPEGWLLDSRGRPTTDPAVLYTQPRGTILPIGGPVDYKGFGLGFMIDTLTGGLSGGMCSHPDVHVAVGNCVFLMLIDISRFGGANQFLHEVGRLSGYVRDCPRADGVDMIQIPGDPERQALAKRQTEGIPIADPLWRKLTELAAQAGITV
jgi:hydroxycarboxylate dehydrogenase B